MRLNHLNLQVPDVQESARFLETYFDFKLLTSRASKAMAVLRGQGGFELVLQRSESRQSSYPQGFHIGFILENAEQVYATSERLKSDGVAVRGIRANPRGTTFYFTMPGGVLTEVSSNRE